MLRSVTFKAVYRSDSDNILEDFYIPALAESVSYDRAVGYFSAGMLSYAAQGLSTFVHREGRMRLIVGGEILPEEAQAISEGYELRESTARFTAALLAILDSVDDAFFYNHVEALSWLVATGRLDIKIALKQKGMYHEKIGIFRDEVGDTVVFQGSANETTSALLPDFNFESINVFQGWIPTLSDHFVPYVEGFEALWNNHAPRTVVLDFPEAAKERLIKIAKTARIPRPEVEIGLWRRLTQDRDNADNQPTDTSPAIPTLINGEPFQIREHQQSALNSWKANDFRGIFAHATGSGKTITAIYGAVRLFEKTKKLFLIVAVPYQNLADQWVTILADFQIAAVRCYQSAEQWKVKASEYIDLYEAGALPFVCFVVVNRTLQSDLFQQLIGRISGNNLMMVADECHHFGSIALYRALPNSADLRLGLSATPDHYRNDEANGRLRDYFGEIVSTFTLEDALKAHVLTPYSYHVLVVELTESEVEKYRALSERIGKVAVLKRVMDFDDYDNDELMKLLLQRARLIGSAEGKLAQLRMFLKSRTPQPLTLFYCGDGSTEDEITNETSRQIEDVIALLGNVGWRSSKFTSREPTQERRDLLDHFRLGFIDGLVAIRCLDEGIDIPGCRMAFMLASSRNPRQSIQRRGRILRRAPGKERAEIIDFVVAVPESISNYSDLERNLFRSELQRVSEFAALADNPSDAVRVLEPLLRRFDLAHMVV